MHSRHFDTVCFCGAEARLGVSASPTRCHPTWTGLDPGDTGEVGGMLSPGMYGALLAVVCHLDHLSLGDRPTTASTAGYTYAELHYTEL